MGIQGKTSVAEETKQHGEVHYVGKNSAVLRGMMYRIRERPKAAAKRPFWPVRANTPGRYRAGVLARAVGTFSIPAKTEWPPAQVRGPLQYPAGSAVKLLAA